MTISLASILIDARPALIRAVLVEFAATVVLGADTAALGTVGITAFIGEEAELVGAALLAGLATAGILGDGILAAILELAALRVLGQAAVEAGAHLVVVALVHEAGDAVAGLLMVSMYWV